MELILSLIAGGILLFVCLGFGLGVQELVENQFEEDVIINTLITIIEDDEEEWEDK